MPDVCKNAILGAKSYIKCAIPQYDPIIKHFLTRDLWIYAYPMSSRYAIKNDTCLKETCIHICMQCKLI